MRASRSLALPLAVCFPPSSVWCARPCSLLLLYVSLLAVGIRLYMAGLEYSADGSSFGQQLLCITGSAACLLAAAFTATKESSESSSSSSSSAASDTEQAAERTATATVAQRHEETRTLIDASRRGEADASDVRLRRIRIASTDESGEPSPDPPRGSSLPLLAARRTRFLVGVLVPLLLPPLLSTYAFLLPQSANGTALSGEISVILFSSVGVAMITVALLLYLSCARKQGKIVGWTMIGLMTIIGRHLVSRPPPTQKRSDAATCAFTR